jgi:hypothetical protein
MIATPPSNIRKYLNTLFEKVTDWEGRAAKVLAVVEANAKEGEDLLRYITRQLDPDHGSETFALETKWFPTYSIRHLQLDDLKFATEAAVKKPGDFTRYVHTFLKNVTFLRNDETLFLSLMRRFDEGAEKYGFQIGDAANEFDPEFVAARSLAIALADLAELHDEANALLPEATTRLGLWIDLSNSLSPHKWQPTFQPIETLWHATLYAKDISATGFLSERPKERKGLGAFGFLNTISMTAEADLATDAANMFHTAWHVAHGNISAQDILTAMQEEGVDKEFDFRSHFGSKAVGELDGPEDAMKLLRLYLYVSQRQSNPVFVNPEELLTALQAIELDQIGVLACDVKLTETTEYLQGEAEFRLMPDQVRSVKLADFKIQGLPFTAELQMDTSAGLRI